MKDELQESLTLDFESVEERRPAPTTEASIPPAEAPAEAPANTESVVLGFGARASEVPQPASDDAGEIVAAGEWGTVLQGESLATLRSFLSPL